MFYHKHEFQLFVFYWEEIVWFTLEHTDAVTARATPCGLGVLSTDDLTLPSCSGSKRPWLLVSAAVRRPHDDKGF